MKGYKLKKDGLLKALILSNGTISSVHSVKGIIVLHKTTILNPLFDTHH